MVRMEDLLFDETNNKDRGEIEYIITVTEVVNWDCAQQILNLHLIVLTQKEINAEEGAMHHLSVRWKLFLSKIA